jgi:Carbohydrate esterase, sialic acid-specific acetylesterase
MKFLFLLIVSFSLPVTIFSQPAVAKKKFYLFLLSGQSNMAGRGRVEAEDTITHKRIWVLNKNNEWELAKEPLHFDKPAVVGVGPGFAFAKKMAEMDTTICIGLIPCAVGGSAIEVWQPAKYYEPTKSYPYDDAVKRTKIAMNAGVLKGILWQQGESDADSVRSKVYGQQLYALVKRFRKEFKTKSLPFMAGTIAAFYQQKHPFAATVNKAIEELPLHLKCIGIVSAAGLLHKGDDTHFSSAAARELGKRYAEAFMKLKLEKR